MLSYFYKENNVSRACSALSGVCLSVFGNSSVLWSGKFYLKQEFFSFCFHETVLGTDLFTQHNDVMESWECQRVFASFNCIFECLSCGQFFCRVGSGAFTGLSCSGQHMWFILLWSHRMFMGSDPPVSVEG